MSLSTEGFIDGYPADPSDPDFAIHCIIDAELRNCFALREETEAPPGRLYPNYRASSREEHQQWLKPALLRFRSNSGREPWTKYLRGLINVLLPGTFKPGVPPDTLLLLVQLGPQLQRNERFPGWWDCGSLNEIVAGNLRLKEQALTPELVLALRKFVDHLVNVHCHQDGTFDIAWQLWRDPGVPDDGVRCFSAIVRQGLRGVSKSESTAWECFWDLRGTNADPHNFISVPYLNKLRKSIRAIGTETFARRLHDWIVETAAEAPATMTAACREVLILLLHGCQAEPALAVDEALFTISGMRWAGTGNARLQKEWLGDLLHVIATRPAGKAFACAEGLSINPDTSCFPEVSFVYHQLLAEITDEVSLPEVKKGVDQYNLNDLPDLYRQQFILDRHLHARMPRERGEIRIGKPVLPMWRTIELPRLLAMRQVSTDPRGYLLAIAARKAWLVKTRKEPQIVEKHKGTFGYEVRETDKYETWICALSELEKVLLASKPSLGPEDLIRVIESAALFPAPKSTALYEIVSRHVRSRGYSNPLVQALEKWRLSLRGNSAAALRRKIGWLLWFESSMPISEKKCWSCRIRKDLRSLSSDYRTDWERLLKTTRFGKSEKPTRKWQREAAAALTGVGPEQFREKLREWFSPFRDGEPVRLTITGRYILQNLIFYALVANDLSVDEAVCWLASADWRAKKDRACARMIFPSFTYVMIQRSDELAYATLENYIRRAAVPLSRKSYRMYEELCVRLRRQPSIPAPPKPEPPDPVEMKRQLFAKYLEGPKAKVEGDQLLVTGVRDNYSIHIDSGRMIRRSDGRSVEINFDAFKAVLGPFKGQLDGTALVDPSGPNYFRVKLCAEILAHDDENAEQILAYSE